MAISAQIIKSDETILLKVNSSGMMIPDLDLKSLLF